MEAISSSFLYMLTMLDRSIPPKFQRIDTFNIGKVKTSTLDNGRKMHYIISDAQPVVKIELLFRSGQVNEEVKGVSSFAYKMLAEGTSSKSAKEISSTIEHYGAQLDITGGTDNSAVSLFCLKKHIPLLLPILKEIMGEASFPEKELENLKSQRIQNLKVNLEKNAFLAARSFRNALFGESHPYGKVLQIEDIAKINREECHAFYKKHIENQFEILLCGDVDDAIFSLLNQYFGQDAVETNMLVKPDLLQIQPQYAPQHIHKEGSLQSAIRIGRPIFTKKHEDHPKLSIINEILGGYFGSRLMKNIREEKGYTYGIHSVLYSFQQHGYWAIGAEVKGENTMDALREIKKEIQKLIEEPVPQDELEIVQNYIMGQFLSSLNTPFALLEKFKSIYLFQQDYNYYDHYLNTLNHCTPEELQAIAAKYWQADDLLEIVVGQV